MSRFDVSSLVRTGIEEKSFPFWILKMDIRRSLNKIPVPNEQQYLR